MCPTDHIGNQDSPPLSFGQPVLQAVSVSVCIERQGQWFPFFWGYGGASPTRILSPASGRKQNEGIVRERFFFSFPKFFSFQHANMACVAQFPDQPIFPCFFFSPVQTSLGIQSEIFFFIFCFSFCSVWGFGFDSGHGTQALINAFSATCSTPELAPSPRVSSANVSLHYALYWLPLD